MLEFTLSVAVPGTLRLLGVVVALRLNEAMTERLTTPVNPCNAPIVIIEVPGVVVLIIKV